MFDYKGFECRQCGKEFTEDDDIVVCPDCGTPYHRSCYKEAGSCTNTELHESCKSWKESLKPEKEPIKCRVCSEELNETQLFCSRCGNPTEFFLKSKFTESGEGRYSNTFEKQDPDDDPSSAMHPYFINFSDPLCGLNPEEKFTEELNASDLRDFVSTNTRYYLPRFKLMKMGRLRLGLNFSAFLFPEFYFAYRRMPWVALIVLVLRMMIDLPSTAVSLQTMFHDESMKTMFVTAFPSFAEAFSRFAEINLNSDSFSLLLKIVYVLDWVLMIATGVIADKLYFRHTLKKATVIKRYANDHKIDSSILLREYGGSSSSMLIGFILLTVFVKPLIMMIMLMLMI